MALYAVIPDVAVWICEFKMFVNILTIQGKLLVWDKKRAYAEQTNITTYYVMYRTQPSLLTLGIRLPVHLFMFIWE